MLILVLRVNEWMFRLIELISVMFLFMVRCLVCRKLGLYRVMCIL